jgi:hypothetical protein
MFSLLFFSLQCLTHLIPKNFEKMISVNCTVHRKYSDEAVIEVTGRRVVAAAQLEECLFH